MWHYPAMHEHLCGKSEFVSAVQHRYHAAADMDIMVVPNANPAIVLKEPDRGVTQPPARRPAKSRKVPKLPDEPAFDRPEETTPSPSRPGNAAPRKRKPRPK